MPQQILPTIMVGVLIAAVMLQSLSSILGAQVLQTHAQPLITGLAKSNHYVQTTLSSFEQTNQARNPVPDNLFSSGVAGNGFTGTVSLVGDSNATGTGTRAQNLDATLGEDRIAVDIVVQTTTRPILQSEVRCLYRGITTGPNYVTPLGCRNVGAANDTTAGAAPDNGGCIAATGAGCDSNNVRTPDNEVAQAVYTCSQGFGSGSCPPSGVFDASNYTMQKWQDPAAGP